MSIPRQIVASVARADLSPAQVGREMRRLIDDGVAVRCVGSARRDPIQLFQRGYTPRHKVELFDTRFYFTNALQNPELLFVVVYVVQAGRSGGRPAIYPRIFYKDLSLVWRTASHYSNSDGLWVGKGDVEIRADGDYEIEESMEQTTDLPLEMQGALESVLAFSRRPRRNETVLPLVLRRSSPQRIRPYDDFSQPRRRAAADPRNRINRGRKVARFGRSGDPSSLRFAPGFEPDLESGVVEKSRFKSRLYHGQVRRFRVLSRNHEIQYGFLAGPRQVWIVPPQATTTELSSYGVRTVDVAADDDLFIPGYEYHYQEEINGTPQLYSQIPDGFAGGPCEHDDAKADASPWLDQIPIIQTFRRKVLRR